MRIALMALFFAAAASAEAPSVPVAKSGGENALDPAAEIWKSAPPVSLALHRTPPLYPTDPPSKLEIETVQLQLIRGAGASFARLEWADRTRDAAELPKAERAWQSEDFVKQSPATNRFSDACALMIPRDPVSGGLNPSLQMGDPAHPVRIFYWDATRGAAVMQASGRETTHRAGGSFPTRSTWAAGKWIVTMELPQLPDGAPVALAVWNGAQQDRDGRKYFTVWRPTR
jgi:DMSO reductase family type II enzyme heme b subunit